MKLPEVLEPGGDRPSRERVGAGACDRYLPGDEGTAESRAAEESPGLSAGRVRGPGYGDGELCRTLDGFSLRWELPGD